MKKGDVDKKQCWFRNNVALIWSLLLAVWTTLVFYYSPYEFPSFNPNPVFQKEKLFSFVKKSLSLRFCHCGVPVIPLQPPRTCGIKYLRHICQQKIVDAAFKGSKQPAGLQQRSVSVLFSACCNLPLAATSRHFMGRGIKERGEELIWMPRLLRALGSASVGALLLFFIVTI